MNDRASSRAPSADDFRRIAAEVLADIPEQFRRHVDGVAILIEEFADEETLDLMGIEDPFDLLGLYHGVSLDHKSVLDPRGDQDMIFLYRRPLLDVWAHGGDTLEDLIRNTLIHEIGHHFGLSDDDMHRLEDED
jgi:predicted Zn-dependent protease with MMP-like domain